MLGEPPLLHRAILYDFEYAGAGPQRSMASRGGQCGRPDVLDLERHHIAVASQLRRGFGIVEPGRHHTARFAVSLS